MVYILWVRHAYSCGNYFSQNTNRDLNSYLDPLLTNYGTKQAKSKWGFITKRLKKLKLRPVPVIFTSTLTRAIQTGHLISNGKVNVIPVSYINELNIGWYHSAYNLPRNKKVVEEELGYEFQVLKSNNPYRKSGDPKHTKPDQELFFNVGLPSIIQTLESQGTVLPDNSVLIFVSHGGFINSVTGNKVGNLGLVLQNVETKKSKVLYKGKKPQKLKKSDISNCLK
jgi:hypothetical protein